MKHNHQRSFESRSRTELDQVIPAQVSQNAEQVVYQDPAAYYIVSIDADNKVEPRLQWKFFVGVSKYLEAIG